MHWLIFEPVFLAGFWAGDYTLTVKTVKKTSKTVCF